MRLDLSRQLPIAERHRQRFTLWWQGRSEREQMLLSVLAALALLWVLVVLVIQPIWNARSDAMASIRTYEMLTVRLRQAGTITGNRPLQRSGSPPAILSASAAELGLAPVITPDRDRYRVVLGDAPYDLVLRWVADVERSSNVRFSVMRLERRPAKGFVSAQFEVHG